VHLRQHGCFRGDRERPCDGRAPARMSGIWGNGEVALPGDPPGELMVVDGLPEGGKIHQLTGVPSAFTPDYAAEEMFEIATKLCKASR
jgi:Mn-containing catalase